MNAHVDYKYHFNGGVFLQHLSRLPGNRSSVYHSQNGDGVIELGDTEIHSVRIVVKDAYQNTSQLNFSIQRFDVINKQPKLQSLATEFVPNYVNVLEKPGFEAYLPETCLYDTLRSYYSRTNTIPENAYSAMHQLNDPSVPVHGELTVRIKPDKDIPEELKDKIVIQRTYRKERSVRKASWQGDWLSAKFGDFGIFQAFVDTVPPTMGETENFRTSDTLDLSSARRIVFEPDDNSGIKNFRVELDGKWLKFTNDKGWAYIYIFDERCPYGVHQLRLRVTDLVGNATIKTWWFKRYRYTPPKKTSAKGRKAKTPTKKSVSQKTATNKKK